AGLGGWLLARRRRERLAGLGDPLARVLSAPPDAVRKEHDLAADQGEREDDRAQEQSSIDLLAVHRLPLTPPAAAGRRGPARAGDQAGRRRDAPELPEQLVAERRVLPKPGRFGWLQPPGPLEPAPVEQEHADVVEEGADREAPETVAAEPDLAADRDRDRGRIG